MLILLFKLVALISLISASYGQYYYTPYPRYYYVQSPQTLPPTAAMPSPAVTAISAPAISVPPMATIISAPQPRAAAAATVPFVQPSALRLKCSLVSDAA